MILYALRRELMMLLCDGSCLQFLFQLCEQCVTSCKRGVQHVEQFATGVAVRFFANMWVFDVEAVVVGADVVDGDFPCLFARLTVAPPCFERFKFAFLNWFGFRKRLFIRKKSLSFCYYLDENLLTPIIF